MKLYISLIYFNIIQKIERDKKNNKFLCIVFYDPIIIEIIWKYFKRKYFKKVYIYQNNWNIVKNIIYLNIISKLNESMWNYKSQL